MSAPADVPSTDWLKANPDEVTRLYFAGHLTANQLRAVFDLPPYPAPGGETRYPGYQHRDEARP